MLMLLFFQHSPPPPGRPFAWQLSKQNINSPHRCNNGRTGRDVPRTNIYTGIMAPDSRGVYNKSTQYCPFITRRRCARCMSACIPTYTCIIILCRRVCLGIRFFGFVRLILFLRHTTYTSSIYDVTKKRDFIVYHNNIIYFMLCYLLRWIRHLLSGVLVYWWMLYNIGSSGYLGII